MLLLLLAVLGATVVLAPFVGRVLGRNAGWMLALPLLGAAVIGALAYVSPSAGDAHAETVAWIPSLNVDFALRIDGLSIVFLILVLLIGAGVLAYSTRYLHQSKPSFYLLMLALMQVPG